MSEQSDIDQREVWDSVYRVITGTLELMIKSAPDHEEAHRRIALVRLDLAVCESGLAKRDEGTRDADAGGTVPAELPQMDDTTVDDLAKHWTREDGLIDCPNWECGAPLSSCDISETGVCRHCRKEHVVLLAYRQGRTQGKHYGEGEA